MELPREAFADASESAAEGPRKIKKATKSSSRVLRIAIRITLGLTVGALLGEWAFRARDGFAFPLVNVYAPDERCGVRLSPETTTRVRLDGQDVTTVHINRDGFRGPDWPSPATSDVLIVGDSQSFGLGVEETNTLRSQLERSLDEAGRPTHVLDASVPTYGPIEYAMTLSRLGERHPETVVLAINLSNDFFELDRPNRDRHSALDGWAVRAQAGLATVRSSSLIESAIRHSHMAFALWKWRRTNELAAAAIEPERDFHDLANSVTMLEQSYDQAAKDREAARQQSVSDARLEVEAANLGMVDMARKYAPLVSYTSGTADEWRAYIAEKGAPGDHVFTLNFGGCEPPPNRRDSYEARFKAGRIRDDVESLLRDFIQLPTLSRTDSNRLRDAFIRRDTAEKVLAARLIAPDPLPGAHPAEAMTHWISTLREEHPEIRFVVVAIPMDVQVSSDARARRSASDAEALALDRLTSDLVSSVGDLGVSTIDPTNDLRAVGNDAYLPDGHLSEQGQSALARSVTSELTRYSATHLR